MLHQALPSLLLPIIFAPVVLGQSTCVDYPYVRIYDYPHYDDTVPLEMSADGSVLLLSGSSSQPTPYSHLEGAVLYEAGAFTALSDLLGTYVTPGGLSRDGHFVACTANAGASGGTAYRWSVVAGFEPIGTFVATGIDEDGDVIVGWAGSSASGYSGFIWRQGGVQTISGAQSLVPIDVSENGQAVVGFMHPSLGAARRAFRWTASQGLQDLGVLGNGEFTATATNHDGSVAVGYSTDMATFASRPFIWTEGNGIDWLQEPQGATSCYASAISPDGQFILGSYSMPDPALGAVSAVVRWSPSSGLSPVPVPVENHWWMSFVGSDVSNDGKRVLIATDLSPGNEAVLLEMHQLGAPYCHNATANSAGCHSLLEATGSSVTIDNDFTLSARRLPVDVFGFFLTSRDTASTTLANSEGILCLGGFIGRFVGPGQILHTGLGDSFDLAVDLTQMPVPVGGSVVQPGETWNFQAWHRDVDSSGQPTSNFTDAVAVTFQ